MTLDPDLGATRALKTGQWNKTAGWEKPFAILTNTSRA